ncbi:MAG: RNA polymerase sigma factor [Acidobacteria bacterium]|nr:MAG: RNA polymerase sigma factor [Acidobacteriota bacterium]
MDIILANRLVQVREPLLKDYEQLSDSELAIRSCAGDEDAFAEIVRRYSPRVFSFVGKFFQQQGVIEEIAQEVFLKIFTQLKSYAHKGSFEGWITRITINTCINELRSMKRETESTFSAHTDQEYDWLERKLKNTSSEEPTEDRLIAIDLVNRILGKMSAEDRLVLILVDAEGYSIREVAEMTGWKESKVKIQAFRARRRMRKAIERLLKKGNTYEK